VKRILPFIAACLLAPSFASAQKREPLPIYVYVGAAEQAVSEEGFVDSSNKWIDDSVADLKKQLDGRMFHPNKGFPGSLEVYHVVASPDDADVSAIIAARGISAATYGQRTTLRVYQGAVLVDTVPDVGVTRWVSMVISVGNYRKEITAWWANQSRFSAGAWTENAKRLALGLAEWVMANEARIQSRHKASVEMAAPNAADRPSPAMDHK
jgi:hypothetical protein